MANETDEVLLGNSGLVKQAAAIKNHNKCCTGGGGGECNLTTLSCHEYDCLAKIGTKEEFTLLLEN